MNAAEELIERGRADGLERGRAEGLERGLREAIAHVLNARALPLSEPGGLRLASCTNIATLTAWLGRAATAASEAEVFGESARP